MAGRGKKIKKKPVSPDPIYGNLVVGKFINHVMKDGKKSLAQKLVYDAFEEVKKTSKKDPVAIFEEALKNAGPTLEVRPTRVGGATYQVPREVSQDRRVALAMRWILDATRKQKGKPFAQKLAGELLAASKSEGEALKKKINMHKMAEANRAFAHFAR